MAMFEKRRAGVQIRGSVFFIVSETNNLSTAEIEWRENIY